MHRNINIVTDAPLVDDWRDLSKRALKLIDIGCIVGLALKYNNGDADVIFFKIIKIKDGTAWGIALDYMRTIWPPNLCSLQDENGDLPPYTGEKFAFRIKDIARIPIDAQPRHLRHKFERYILSD